MDLLSLGLKIAILICIVLFFLKILFPFLFSVSLQFLVTFLEKCFDKKSSKEMPLKKEPRLKIKITHEGADPEPFELDPQISKFIRILVWSFVCGLLLFTIYSAFVF